ncbi:calcium/sodium antiporter [Jiangella alba]|uniref:Cation:H+ antiporter n=1 Tax=Jiangella alba TaxID=561176 RepID=A0A1H5PXN5_9ACTN|nr:calcium/sodium antiporter [Jiangella alba]SEF18394.1 cation:H+ antiporter [Jiangella alba]
MSSALLIAVGFAGLLGGAELLVRGGTGLALRLGIAPIVVGVTVVALGTSLPELAVGIDAARQDSAGLAVGNIVGTNLVNLLLILGLSAAIAPIALDARTLRLDLPLMAGAALLLLAVALDGTFGRVDGVVLVLFGVGYTLAILYVSRRESAAVRAEYDAGLAPADRPGTRGRPWRDLLSLAVGIAIIVVGATLLVDGAVDAARSFGVSDAVIGLTVIAIGTSAPELVTTIVSTVRGNRDIALGNLLGSSVYNIAIILGITILAAPDVVQVPDEVLGGDLLLMVAVALACIPVFVSGRRISRVEGGLFVAAYAGYLTWLLVAQT